MKIKNGSATLRIKSYGQQSLETLKTAQGASLFLLSRFSISHLPGMTVQSLILKLLLSREKQPLFKTVVLTRFSLQRLALAQTVDFRAATVVAAAATKAK